MHRFRLHFNAICVLILLAIAGCRPEACADFGCENGNCLEGECVCDAGYEGISCNTTSRERLLGDWVVGDICRTVADVYDISVAAGPAINEIVFDNLDQAGRNVQGIVDAIDITLPSQTFGPGFISGTGGIDINAQVISLEYAIDDGNGNIDVCQASLRHP